MAHVTAADRLEELLRRAWRAGAESGDFPAEGVLRGEVRPCADPGRGDYTASHALASAAGLGLSPAETAARLAGHFSREQTDFAPPEAVGGYLNFRLTESWYTRTLNAAACRTFPAPGAVPPGREPSPPERRDDVGDPSYRIRYVRHRCRTLAALEGSAGPADAAELSSERERRILRLLDAAPAVLEPAAEGDPGRAGRFAAALAEDCTGLYSAGSILNAAPAAGRARAALCRGVYAALTACLEAQGLPTLETME